MLIYQSSDIFGASVHKRDPLDNCIFINTYDKMSYDEEYASSKKKKNVKVRIRVSGLKDETFVMCKDKTLTRPENVVDRASISHIENEKYMNKFNQVFASKSRIDQEEKEEEDTIDRRRMNSNNNTNNQPSTSTTTTSISPIDNSLSNVWRLGPLQNPEGTLYPACTQPITSMSVSHNQIVVGSCDHACYAFDLPNNNKTTRGLRRSHSSVSKRTLYTKRYGHTEWVTCVAHLSNNTPYDLISGGMDSKLCLWNTNRKSCIDCIGHAGSISNVIVASATTGNSTPAVAISSSYDKTLIAWDVNKGTKLITYKGHKQAVLLIHWLSSSARQEFISGDRNGTVIHWDVSNERPQKRYTKAHVGHVTSLSSPCCNDEQIAAVDPNVFLSGGQDGHVRVWDVRTGSSIYDIPLHVNTMGRGAVSFIEYSQVSNAYVTAGADGVLHVLEPRSSYQTRHSMNGHGTEFIYSLHVQQNLCFSGANDGMLLVHDLDSGSLLYGLGANQAAIRSIATIPSSNTLIAAGDDGNIVVYDLSLVYK